MKKTLLIACMAILALFCTSALRAQNLVQNPSFETFTGTCLLAGYGSLTNWYNPDPYDSCSTPDWFSTCNILGAPSNQMGNQAALTGNSYAGAILYDPTLADYREYIENKLASPLVAGQTYCVTFYVSLADNSPSGVNKLGVYFSNNITQYSSYNCSGPLPVTPQLQATAAVLDKTNWVKEQWSYTATGGEQYMTIGNFFNDAQTTRTTVAGGAGLFDYYFFDEVSVVAGPCPTLQVELQTGSTTCGNCNGTASALTSGDNAPFTYLWGGGQTTQALSNLCTGTYTVTVTDATHNTVSSSSSVTAGSGFTLTTSSTSAGCGSSNGSATVTPGGLNIYNYDWSNGGDDATISNVAAGIYTVTVSQVFGSCSATASVSVSSNGGLVASVTPTNASCGNSNGAATANVGTGTGPFTYTWSNGATTQTVNGLAANTTYNVTISGSGGCSVTASAAIGASGNLVLSQTASATTCGSSNGQAAVNVTTGTGPFTYLWSNGNTTSSISNLSAATYNVTVSNSGCSATASASVGASTGFTLAHTATATTCNNSNGAATVSIATGTGPFTYLWSNGNTTASISNINGGTYTVTVTAGNCTAAESAVVDTSAGLILSAFGGRAGCTSSGTATVSVTTGAGPFAYLWSTSATTASVNSLSAGNYAVTVTGAASCSASASVTVISTGSGVSLTANVNNPACGGTTGSASVTVLSGDSPFTYAWSNNASDSSLTNLATGTYTVTVTGGGGCSATASLAIVVPQTAVLTPTSTTTTCGANNGSVSVSVNGNGVYNYIWSNGATVNTVSNLSPGTYTVTVSGNGVCSATASAIVASSGGTVPIQAEPNNTICAGDTSQICAPAGFLSYHWNLGQTTQCISAIATGNYYVTVTDNGNCTATSNHISLTVNTPTAVTIGPRGDSLVASSASSYQWYFNGTPISGATASFYIPAQGGNYYVQATDVNGCHANSNAESIKTFTGVDQLTADGQVKVYPNPLTSGSSWHLEVGNEWIGSVCEVYDAAGRIVYKTEIKAAQSEIELSVAQGIYLMRINSLQKNFTIKLIKL